jgi:hypothetical protein
MELTDKQKAELDAIKSLPDDQIDTSDAPEILDWSKARRGLLYLRKPKK